ncbi:MAG: hypothetical protein JWP81_1661 [Ferruginibacter sp.]|nr:hypothetical protein [Ferruginibacter sp.]
MKRWMVAVLIAVFAVAASPYIFIPGTITIHRSIAFNTSPNAIRRLLIENNQWNKAWIANDSNPAMKNSGQSVFYDGNSYSLTDRKYSSILLAIHCDKDTFATASLDFITLSKDSVKLDWNVTMPVPSGPIRRLEVARKSRKIEADIATLLNKMESFFSKTENVYGIHIQRESVVDTSLLFTYDSSRGYPDMGFVYSRIAKLKNYISTQDADITGYPMLNIYTKDSMLFLVKVALPVNKKLTSNGRMTYKWMLPHGNILVTEVKGGAKTIDHAFEQMGYFMKDYGLVAPAIPFLSLVTDRMKEKDSTQWITRIYYPVMDL